MTVELGIKLITSVALGLLGVVKLGVGISDIVSVELGKEVEPILKNFKIIIINASLRIVIHCFLNWHKKSSGL